jgi:hypothetical protein
MALNPMMLAQLLQGKATQDGSGPGALSGLGSMAEDMTKQMSPLIYMLAGAGLKEIPRLLNSIMDFKSSNQPGELQEEPEQAPGAASSGGQPQGTPPGGAPAGPGANPMAAIMAMMAARGAMQPGGAPPGMPPPGAGPVGGMGPLAALMAARQRMGG